MTIRTYTRVSTNTGWGCKFFLKLLQCKLYLTLGKTKYKIKHENKDY